MGVERSYERAKNKVEEVRTIPGGDALTMTMTMPKLMMKRDPRELEEKAWANEHPQVCLNPCVYAEPAVVVSETNVKAAMLLCGVLERKTRMERCRQTKKV